MGNRHLISHFASLTPSQMNSHFHFEGVSYSEYIEFARQLIQKARIDLSNLSPEQIQQRIEANTPTEVIPESGAHHGILLVHGLISSPMAMSSLQNYFGERGYLVRSILLPGHGTRPGDLLDVTYEDWLDACRFGIKTLREEVEHVTVVAFSAGTALAVYLSLLENSIDSLVLLAPALSLRSALSYIIPYVYPFRKYSTAINWPILKKEDDYAKYQSIPLNAIYQITKLMKKIHAIEHRLSIPIYIASTVDDETISHDKALNFFLKQSNPLNRGIVYSSDSDIKLPSSLLHRRSTYPEEKILDFSHISLAVAPDHPHYGKQGDFSDFSHYSRRPGTKHKTHKHRHKPIHHGSVLSKNLDKHHVQRLSYNPDFEFLAEHIHSFLKECFSSND